MTSSTSADTSPSTPQQRIRSIIGELELLSRQVTATADGQHDHVALERLARGLLWQRAVIAEHLDPAHFVDPGSNLMLFLYAAGPDASPSSGICCEAARVPRTTALRWIAILEHKGLVKTLLHPQDRRKTTVALTSAGRAAMQRCLMAIAEAPPGGLSLP